MRNNGLDCLAGIDPSDPGLAVPDVQVLTSQHLCSWVGGPRTMGSPSPTRFGSERLGEDQVIAIATWLGSSRDKVPVPLAL